jgi:hypothetical protein
MISLAILSVLSADEITRVGDIVDDISKLRTSYESCKLELESKKIQNVTPKIESQKEATSTCQEKDKEIQKYKNLLKQSEGRYSILSSSKATKQKAGTALDAKRVAELEKMLEEQNETIKNKEREIVSLKKELAQKVKFKESKSKTTIKEREIPQSIDEENEFPKLKKKESSAKVTPESEDLYATQATFRLNNDSSIYNAINGAKVAQWNKDTSFTSNLRSKQWIRISGYFVDKVWQRAKEELWIENRNVTQR